MKEINETDIVGVWETAMNILANETTAFVLSGLLFLYFIYEIIRYYQNLNPLISSMQKANSFLLKYADESGFRKGFESFSIEIKGIPLIRHQWNEFVETLIPQENSVFNIIDAEEFFSEEQIFASQIHMSHYIQLPNILTGLGILGTFLGLLGGISSVSGNLTETGIGSLLDGASVAFMTSITGLVCSMSFLYLQKRRYHLFKDQRLIWISGLDGRLRRLNRESIAFDTLKSQEKMTEILTRFVESFGIKISDGMKDAQTQQLILLRDIKDSINGPGLDSIKSQSQELRALVDNRLKEFSEKFDQFSKELAENSTKAIIAALEDVVKDFNKNLNEQFGDNFKQLNESVEKLLEWQENYKAHVEHLDAQFTKSLEGINEVNNALSLIRKETEAFPEPARQMGVQIQFFNTQIETLSELSATLKDQIIKVSDTFQQVTNSIVETGERAQGGMAAYQNHLDEALKKLDTISLTHQESLKESIEGINKFRDESLNILRDGFKNIDEGLEEELQKSLNSLGNNLVLLSNKFVEDYTPLTEKLKELIRNLGNHR